MGTSKSYIAPTKPIWSEAKRAVSSLLRNNNSESRSKAVSKFAQAMASAGNASNDRFAISAGNVLDFARNVSSYGVNDALATFGLSDLIDKDPSEIMDALIDQFVNNDATLSDSITGDALSLAFSNLKIESPEDFGNVGINVLLREMIIEYINMNFDLRYEEKIGKGRLPDEKFLILNDVHKHIANLVIEMLDDYEMAKIDFNQLKASEIVANTLNDAYKECIAFYGEV